MYIYVYTYIKGEERGEKNEGSTEQAYAEKSFRQTGYKEVLPYSRIRCYKSRSLPAFSCPLAKSPSPHSVQRINLRSTFFQFTVFPDQSVGSIDSRRRGIVVRDRQPHNTERLIRRYSLLYRSIYIVEMYIEFVKGVATSRNRV